MVRWNKKRMKERSIMQALEAGELTEVRLGNPDTYPCDPAKNKHCRKTNCYLNGGECTMTTNPNYKK